MPALGARVKGFNEEIARADNQLPVEAAPGLSETKGDDMPEVIPERPKAYEFHEVVNARWNSQSGVFYVRVDADKCFAELEETARVLREALEKSESRYDDALMIIRILLLSAVPNPKEHPTMAKAWAEAQAFIGKQDITRAALRQAGVRD